MSFNAQLTGLTRHSHCLIDGRFAQIQVAGIDTARLNAYPTTGAFLLIDLYAHSPTSHFSHGLPKAVQRSVSASVQAINMIDNVSRHVGLNRFVDAGDVGHDRADASLLHTFIRACSHPTAQQHFAIGNRLGHARVPILRHGIKAVLLAGLMHMRFVGEVRVAQFVAALAPDDLTVFDRGDHVIWRAAKMLADALFVVSYHGYFHFRFLLSEISI
jgi:hypothetical protein